MLSPSLRRLSVSSVVSTGFLCPSVVSPVSPAPSVVRAPLAFFPAGYGRLLRRPALGGSGDSFSLRRLRSLRSSSAPPSALRSFLRSSVPPPLRATPLRRQAGAARRPLLQRAAGAARRPRRLRSPPLFARPRLRRDLASPFRAAASPPPFTFGVSPLSSGALCRPRLPPPPRAPPAPAPRLLPAACMFHMEHSCSCNYSQL